jgi:hypothetical protein
MTSDAGLVCGGLLGCVGKVLRLAALEDRPGLARGGYPFLGRLARTSQIGCPALCPLESTDFYISSTSISKH